MSLEEYEAATLSETLFHLEVFKERMYWHAKPFAGLLLQQVDDEGVEKMLNSTGGNPRRAEALNVILREYMPHWRREQAAPTAQPLQGLSPRAAEGLVQAAEQGLIDDVSWLQFVNVWDRVIATAATS